MEEKWEDIEKRVEEDRKAQKFGLKEPKLNKILLNDNSCLTDLVFLEKPATEKEITLVINEVIANKPMEYTNEDIYYAIDKAFGIKEMIDLSSIKEFCY